MSSRNKRGATPATEALFYFVEEDRAAIGALSRIVHYDSTAEYRPGLHVAVEVDDDQVFAAIIVKTHFRRTVLLQALTDFEEERPSFIPPPKKRKRVQKKQKRQTGRKTKASKKKITIVRSCSPARSVEGSPTPSQDVPRLGLGHLSGACSPRFPPLISAYQTDESDGDIRSRGCSPDRDGASDVSFQSASGGFFTADVPASPQAGSGGFIPSSQTSASLSRYVQIH